MTLLDLIFPRRCVSCGKIGNYFCKKCITKIEFVTQSICPVCVKPAIDGMTHPRCQTKYSLDGLISFFRYDGIIRKAIKTVKYRFVSDLAKEFITLIPQTSLTQLIMDSRSGQSDNSTMLIPIPLYPSRMKFRGFNQAEVLGKVLAKRLNSVRPVPMERRDVNRTNPERSEESHPPSFISVKTDILKRVRKTIPQVEMKERAKRLKNMEGVFAVNQQAMKQLNNETILLFDDVFTTGATLRSATNVLKRAGCKKIWGVVLAHG